LNQKLAGERSEFGARDFRSHVCADDIARARLTPGARTSYAVLTPNEINVSAIDCKSGGWRFELDSHMMQNLLVVRTSPAASIVAMGDESPLIVPASANADYRPLP
jgi:hypothetical protein